MQSRRVALLPVLGLILVGCSGAEAPQPAPLPTVSEQPSPTPSGAPPRAQAPTPQGAAAFVTYYYEQLGAAFSSLDTTEVRRLSAPECVDCRNIAEAIDRERDTGRVYSGGAITVRSAEAVPNEDGSVAVSLVYDNSPLILENATGGPSPRPARRGVTLEVTVVRAGASWLVSDIVRVNG